MRFRPVAKLALLPVTALSLVALAACGSSGGSSAGGSKAPQVGVVILSGPVGANEDHMKVGFTLAQADITKAGGPKISLVMCEDQVNVDQSTACTRKLTSQDGLKAVILDTASPDALADSAITGHAGVVALLPSQRDTILTAKGTKNLFRTGISGAVEVTRVTPEIVQDLKPKSIGILAENNSFGQDEDTRFTAAFKNAGVQVVYSSTFDATQTDFSPELTKVKAANPDVLLMIGEANHGALISQQAKTLGLTSKLVASSGMTSPDLITLAKGAMNGQYAWSTLPISSATAKDFTAKFQAKYHVQPDSISAEAYTALRTLATAIQQAGGADDPAKLSAALAKVSWNSPIGQVKFDSQGQNVNAVTELQQVSGGSFVPVPSGTASN
jgi:branched-chain amino acid transport system substrate-binding protein